MKLKRMTIILTVIALLGIMGCKKTENNQSSEESTITIVDSNTTDTNSDEINEADNSSSVVEVPLTEEYANAYADVLERIYKEQILPDGTALDLYDSFGSIEDNTFAIADVDGDGIKELVVMWSTADMAGMAEFVYKYVPEKKEVVEEFVEFPGIEFYTDGLASVGWSHNQGHGEMWPYTIYKYDSATMSYQCLGNVDSWNKEIADTDYDGNPYPADVDKENSGVVYCINYGDEYTGQYYSQADYDEFYGKVFDSHTKLEFNYFELKSSRIDKLREGKLDPVIKGKTVHPAIGKIDTNNLVDGIYAANIDPSNVFENGDNGLSAYIDVYQKEVYDIVDMNTLEVGDGIECDGIVVEIESIENTNGCIYINGGIDVGGLDFRAIDEENCYVYFGFDDIATYHKCGSAYLDIPLNCVITDKSNLEHPDGVTVNVPEFIDYMLVNNLYMNIYNTRITVQDREIVELTVTYMP